MSTITSTIKELPLTAAILNERSLDNIIEDNELEQKLSDYVPLSTFKPDDIQRAAVDEAVLSCYTKSETSSSQQLTIALSRKIGIASQSCVAAGIESRAFGDSTSAEGSYSFSEGANTVVSGDCSHAEGDSSIAIGYAAHAEGDSNIAEGDFTHAEGLYSIASYDYSHAEGVQTTAACKGAHTEGKATLAGTAFKVGQLVLEDVVVTPQTYTAFSDGNPIEKRFIDGITENFNPDYERINIKWKIVLDGLPGAQDNQNKPGQRLADAIGKRELAFEYDGAQQERPYEPVIKNTINVSDTRKVEITAHNLAKLPASAVWDGRIDLRIWNGDGFVDVHCFPDKESALDIFNKTFFSDATPTQAHAVDLYALNTLLQYGSTQQNEIWLSDELLTEFQHAEGYSTLAYGRASHAEGEKTRAVGSISHAEGYDNTAYGHGSRVNGVHSFTEGKYSTAIGKCVNAKGDYSIAAGNCVTAKDANSFAWSGDYVGHNLINYTSQGIGTFCVNPKNGLNGFYIGDKTFVECVLASIVNGLTAPQKQTLKDFLLQLLDVEQEEEQPAPSTNE